MSTHTFHDGRLRVVCGSEDRTGASGMGGLEMERTSGSRDSSRGPQRRATSESHNPEAPD